MNIKTFSDLLRAFANGELHGKHGEMTEGWMRSFDSRPGSNEWTTTDAEEEARFAELTARIESVEQKRIWTIWLSAAASVVFVLASIYAIWNYQPRQDEVATTTPKEITLPDGSTVILEPGSKLQYPKAFSDHERAVILTGDAFFKVVKDSSRTFIVTCGNLETRVLGTSFMIRSKPAGDVAVDLVSGRVALASEDAYLELAPHEQGVFRYAEHTIRKSVADSAQWVALVNNHYTFKFEDSKFSEVMETLSIRFGVTFTVESPGIGDCLFTADLTNQTLQQALNLARQSKISEGFDYTISERNVIIRGKGCK